MEDLTYGLDNCKNSAPGPDELPFILLQRLPPEGKTYLLQAYIELFQSGSFPATWSTAYVVPIAKNKINRNLTPYHVGQYLSLAPFVSC